MKTFKEVAEDIVNKMEEGVIPNTQSAKQKLYNKYIEHIYSYFMVRINLIFIILKFDNITAVIWYCCVPEL